MPEDEERTEGEDLFEDLDKFFAPIQDVDWPESSEGKGSERAAGAERRDEPSRVEPEQPEGDADPRTRRRRPPSPARDEPAGGDERFAAQESPSEPDVEPAEQGGVGSFLFEAEAESYDVDEGAEAGSSGYVDLPGDEPGVAELIEETETVVVPEVAPEKRRKAGGRAGHRGRRGRGRPLRRVRPGRGAGRAGGAGTAAHRGGRDRPAPRRGGRGGRGRDLADGPGRGRGLRRAELAGTDRDRGRRRTRTRGAGPGRPDGVPHRSGARGLWPSARS